MFPSAVKHLKASPFHQILDTLSPTTTHRTYIQDVFYLILQLVVNKYRWCTQWNFAFEQLQLGGMKDIVDTAVLLWQVNSVCYRVDLLDYCERT